MIRCLRKLYKTQQISIRVTIAYTLNCDQSLSVAFERRSKATFKSYKSNRVKRISKEFSDFSQCQTIKRLLFYLLSRTDCHGLLIHQGTSI